MKILFYSDAHIPEASSTPISNAMERAGHIVCRWGRHERQGFPLADIVKCANLYKVNCFIFMGGREIYPSQMIELQAFFPKAVFCQWNFDLMSNFDIRPWFEPLAKLMDVCFEVDASVNEFWSQPEIHRVVVRYGIDPAVYQPIPKERISDADREKYSSDVAFVGMPYELCGRRDLMDKVANWCGQNGKTFKIWGHWTEYVLGDDLAKVVALTKVMIGHESANDLDSPNGTWTDRVYRTLGYGGFFIAHYRPGMETEFEDGTDLQFWRRPEHLLEIIRLSLESDTFRRVVANSGCRRVRTQYTWDERIKGPMRAIAEIARKRSAAYD